MNLISIAGEKHAVERAGVTLCGHNYPARWPHLWRGEISCPACDRILNKRAEAQMAKFREIPTVIGPDLPFD